MRGITNVLSIGTEKYYVAGAGYYMNQKGEYLHHKVLAPKKGFVIDHINGDKLDNRPENLRYATQQQNTHNQRVKSATGYRMVTNTLPRYKDHPYQVQIKADGKNIYFGRYETAEEAAHVADQVMLQLHGEFARTNFTYN